MSGYHIYTLKRGRHGARWRFSGMAHPQKDGCIGVHIEMVPVTGFSGFALLVPQGQQPPPLRDYPYDDDGDEGPEIIGNPDPKIN
jgi:hypothetical protein